MLWASADAEADGICNSVLLDLIQFTGVVETVRDCTVTEKWLPG